jgi:hypothetical protein
VTTRKPPGPRRGAREASREPEPPFEPRLRELRSAIANLRALGEALNAGTRRPAAALPKLLPAVLAQAERASHAVDRLAELVVRRDAGIRPGAATTVARFADDLLRRAAEQDLIVTSGTMPEARFVAPAELPGAILAALAQLRRDYGVGEFLLGAALHETLVALDLSFGAREPESSRLREAHAAVLAEGARGDAALGDVARAAGGEAWLAIRRGEATFSLRILLPRAEKR